MQVLSDMSSVLGPSRRCVVAREMTKVELLHKSILKWEQFEVHVVHRYCPEAAFMIDLYDMNHILK